MNYTLRTVPLKDGRTAAMQSPTAAHAEQMISYMKAMSAETECVGRYPEEIIETIDYESDLLNSTLSSPNSVQISIFADGIIAANATIAPYSGQADTQHRYSLNVWLLLSQHPSCLRNPTSFST